MATYIVTRHIGAIAWLKSQSIEGDLISQWEMENTAKLAAGDFVVGVLPVPLIAKILKSGARFGLLNLPNIAFTERGKELSLAEMHQAGANVEEVRSVLMGDRLV